ncbi:hypothetical protein LDVICp053 [lymphocystis disease virus-China]|uniref:Uncharacterized protein n=2 Tax=Lymphocystis disease virus 2 TaxID=159183 RepID=A0A6F8X1N0_9VIRU|nr:hypothetical protein LDVICp053 [lymphocystis disease virus-China]AAU10899.1 hypothetical protein [lymphocystis disease virus-China]BCB67441.1 hypothetical protein [Lymphocystis disease virus 2]
MFSTSYQPPQFINLNQPPAPETKKEMSKPKPISESYAFGYLPPVDNFEDDDVVVEETIEESEEIDYGDEEPILTEEGNIVFDDVEEEEDEEDEKQIPTTEDKTRVYLFLEDYSNREISLLPFTAMLTPVEQWNIIKKALFTGFSKVDGLEKVADKYIKLVADAILINRDQIEDYPTAYYFLSYAKSRGLV